MKYKKTKSSFQMSKFLPFDGDGDVSFHQRHEGSNLDEVLGLLEGHAISVLKIRADDSKMEVIWHPSY